jgi:hypothetical protein
MQLVSGESLDTPFRRLHPKDLSEERRDKERKLNDGKARKRCKNVFIFPILQFARENIF